MGRRWSGKSCRLSTMMLLTSSFFLVEIIVGYLTNSIALVADSFHMLSDVVALVIGFASVRLSKRRSTRSNTYGWQRAEVLGALINSVFLLALIFSILVEAMKRMVEVEKVESPLMMLAVGGMGLVINLAGLCLFGGHGHSHGSNGGHGHSHSHNTRGSNEGQGHCHNQSQPAKVKVDDNFDHGHCDKEILSDGKVPRLYGCDVDPNSVALGVTWETKCLVPSGQDSFDANAATAHINNRNIINSIAGNHMNGLQEKSSIICHPGDDHPDKEICPNGSSNKNNNKNNVEIEMGTPPSAVSLNMRGVFLHVLGDALGSVVVVISALAIWFVDGDWKYYLDPALSITIVGIILYTTIPLFKETAHILLQAIPQDIRVDDIVQQILQIEGVAGVHECHIWQLSGRRFIASVHVHCNDLRDYMTLASKIKEVFHQAGIHSTTIQPELDKKLADTTKCSLLCPEIGGDITCIDHTCCRIKSDID